VDGLDLMQGWRREAVGQAVLAFLAGESELRGVWRDGALSASAAKVQSVSAKGDADVT
jgi:hypothetical protein